MAINIRTNLPALTAQRNLDSASNKLNTSYQRLSSGLRINRASDDAAGDTERLSDRHLAGRGTRQ